jgi:hypothetical protein
MNMKNGFRILISLKTAGGKVRVGLQSDVLSPLGAPSCLATQPLATQDERKKDDENTTP